MEYADRMAMDIGMVMQNEYPMQKHLEQFAANATIGHTSNEIAYQYYARIHACLTAIEETARHHLLDCSPAHAVLLNDGAMLIREICLNLGYTVFDTLAADYYEFNPLEHTVAQLPNS